MKNKKRKLIILQPVQTQTFSKLLLGTYYMPKNQLPTEDTKVKGSMTLALEVYGLQGGPGRPTARIHGEGSGQVMRDQKQQPGIPRRQLHI